MPRSAQVLVALLTIAVLWVVDAAAQKISCIQPTESRQDDSCTVTLRSATAQELIIVRVEGRYGVLRDTTVKFRASTGDITDTDKVDSRGEAQARWSGSAGDGPVTITVEAKADDGRLLTKKVQLRPPPRSTPLTLVPSPWGSGDFQAWYEERQLRHPVSVLIQGVPGAEQCRQTRVVFRQIGTGQSSPDSTFGEWTDSRGCIAQSTWRLGKGIGRQHLQASLAGEPVKSTTFTAFARALPRLTTGLAWSYASKFNRAEITRNTVRVARTIRPDSVLAMDSVAVRRSVDSVKASWNITPIVGIEWPIINSARKVRISASASLLDPDKDWFLGVSALQPIWGLSHEALGVDVHAVMHFSRREVVVNPQTCGSEGSAMACATDRQTRPVGGGLMLIVDSTALLGNLLSIFGA